MATHSSVLAWRIPGTEEPGGLPSMGSHRVGHDWSDLAAAAVWILRKENGQSHVFTWWRLRREEEMIKLAKQIVEEKLPVREVEKISPDMKKKVQIERKVNTSSSEYKYVEDLLREKLDTKVKIKDKKIEINFNNVNDLNRILEILNIKEQ